MNVEIQNTPPLVSISVITYNHAGYIRECLDSLLMQQCDFPYEICIGEDGSTDGTREICMEYAKKYPTRIRLELHERSDPERKMFSAPANCNAYRTFQACTGTYLAFCEGDDQWIDPLKLQKQVDLMQADPELVLVHSDFDKLDVISGKRTHAFNKKHKVNHIINPDPSRFMYDLILLHYPISPCTALVRYSALAKAYEVAMPLFQTLPMGDIPKWCELSVIGKFHYMPEALSLYRALPESASNTQSPSRMFQFVNKASNVGLMLAERYDLPIREIRAYKVKNSNRDALLSGERNEIKTLWNDPDFPFSWPETLLYLAGGTPLLGQIARSLFIKRYWKNKNKTT